MDWRIGAIRLVRNRSEATVASVNRGFSASRYFTNVALGGWDGDSSMRAALQDDEA
jgi:hypothetical protein